MKSLRLGLLVGIVAVAACVPKREPPPPQPQPMPQQQPRPLPPPPPAAVDWRDAPLTPGNWYYRNEGAASQALFGVPNSEGVFIVRCDRARRQVILSREGIAAGNAMTIRTTSTARNFPITVQREPLAYTMAALQPNDRFLDEIVFSRGRFTVEAPGTQMLIIPAWPEPARVVEDCRS